ncbi:MAG: hypothetical protein COA42_23805 [Alteromonadaceae bacterium]|nr:MAG: hypothetical protein COA42_23805 [Alteromonadaceae bacterium]
MNISNYVRDAVVILVMFGLAGCKLSGDAVGIDGEVLIEESNTGEVLYLSGDGEFQFSHNYKDGDTYNVVINSSEQSCSVKNATGAFFNTNISDVEVICDDGPVFCTKHYDPVCAVATQEIQCFTTPCNPLETYKTFGNACEAGGAKANIVFSDACNELEGEKASGIEMVPFATTRFDRGDRINVHSVSLEGVKGLDSYYNDVFLKVNLSYSGGCNEHDFTLFGNTEFEESFPVQDSVYLFHQGYNDTCDSIVTEDVMFYLKPLKEEYKKAYQVEYGEVVLNITAPGANPVGSKAPEKLYQVTYRFDDRPKGKLGDVCGGFTLWPGHPYCGMGLSCQGKGLPVDLPGTCQVSQ